MKITTTVSTRMERSDGRVTEVSHTEVKNAGENPRFEVHEVSTTITAASMQVLDSVAAGRTDQLP